MLIIIMAIIVVITVIMVEKNEPQAANVGYAVSNSAEWFEAVGNMRTIPTMSRTQQIRVIRLGSAMALLKQCRLHPCMTMSLHSNSNRIPEDRNLKHIDSTCTLPLLC